MCHDNEEWCKIWSGIDLSIQSWHEEFDRLWPKHLKVSKTLFFMCSFWKKYILFELKKCRGIIFHETEEGYKICRGINSSFPNWQNEFDKIWLEHLKVSKIFILMGSFWAKYILLELKKYRVIIFHETEGGYTICGRIDSSFKNWHKEFDKIWPKHSKVSKVFILMGSFWTK